MEGVAKSGIVTPNAEDSPLVTQIKRGIAQRIEKGEKKLQGNASKYQKLSFIQLSSMTSAQKQAVYRDVNSYISAL